MALIVPKLQRHQHCAGSYEQGGISTLECNACRHIQTIYLKEHELQGTSIQGANGKALHLYPAKVNHSPMREALRISFLNIKCRPSSCLDEIYVRRISWSLVVKLLGA